MRFFIFAPISTRQYNAYTRCTLHVAAASNKVTGIAKSVSMYGFTQVVSCPITTKFRSKLFFPKYEYLDEKISYVFLASLTAPLFNRVWGSIFYLYYALKKIRRGDKVILYNFFPEYILLAIYLYIFKNKAVMDVEDAPNNVERGLRGIVNRVSYSILNILCADYKLVAATVIADKLKIQKFISLPGVQNNIKDKIILDGERVKILFGGAMLAETGVYLFCDALNIISKMECAKYIEFYITGFGDAERLIEVTDKLREKLCFNVSIDCSIDEYRSILDKCDVGLSLKLPGTAIGDTTFPSKCLEYVAHNLLLISTPVSDVPSIFDSNSAYILSDISPVSLSLAIQDVINNKIYYRNVADRGRELIREKFSAAAVGRQLFNFFNEQKE